MDLEQAKFEALWQTELEKAREELDKILEDGSEELLVQRLIEQDELDKEEARQSASIAIQFAMESIAKLRVLKAQLEAKAQEVEDNG